MTARISRCFQLNTGVYFSGDFFVNTYDIQLQFNVLAESIKEQNIAMDRIKYFVHECIEHSILVHQDETTIIEKYIDADLKVCTLPEEPYDQIIGIMLLEKINAITEGRLTVTDIAIGSSMSDGVECLQSEDENIGPFRLPGWWQENNTKIANYSIQSKGKKIVKLAKPTVEWKDIGLSYDDTDEQPDSSESNVVLALFDHKLEK